MTCLKNTKLARWEQGDDNDTFIAMGSLKIPINYFTCGTFFFVVFFHVVSFPYVMLLYL